MQTQRPDFDVAVVGAGPIGIAVGAAGTQVGLKTLLLDQGPILSGLLDYPIGMRFFSTRERLAIAGIPFSLPEDRPSREQALAYYQGVYRAFRLSSWTFCRVEKIVPSGDLVELQLLSVGRPSRLLTRAVVVATGFSSWPKRLGVVGEEEPWVRHRFREAWQHFGERVVVIGGGNSAIEAALSLYRHGAEVIWIHRGAEPKPSVKYWLKPDFLHRIAEGSIQALPNSFVTRFQDGRIELETPTGPQSLRAEAAYVLIGFRPDLRLLVEAGVELTGPNREPCHDAETGATSIPGVYVAGTVRAGEDTHRIFIENARADIGGLVRHILANRLGGEKAQDMVQKLLSHEPRLVRAAGFEEE